jgi:hypothetical protein
VRVAEDEGVEPLAFTPPRFSGPVASLPSGILRGVAEGIGIEPMRRYSDRRLASEYLTARSTLHDYREGLNEISGRMAALYIDDGAHGRTRTYTPKNGGLSSARLPFRHVGNVLARVVGVLGIEPRWASKGRQIYSLARVPYRSTRRRRSQVSNNARGVAGAGRLGSAVSSWRAHRNATVAQLVEATDLKSVQCGFDSHGSHQMIRS